MNERIRELGDQAWDYALDHETVNGKAAFGSFINKNFSDLLLEKFAELIVAECADVCENLQKWPSTEPRHCANDIRIHFGVEE